MLKRLSFTARIFLASALLVVAALTVSAVATYTRGYQIARSAATDSLAHSRAVQQNFQKLRFQQLRLMSQLMASDPSFLSYVAEAAGNGLTSGGQVDVRSITDLLTERQGEIGFDFGMVLDQSGVLLARSGSVAARENLAANPVVTAAMQAQGPAAGYWLREGRAYQVAVAPLANRDELLGYLVLGLAVDQSLLQDVKQVSGAEIVLLDSSAGSSSVVTSTLDPQRLDGLNQSLTKLHPLPSGAFDVDLGGEHWLAYAEPLGSAGTALTLTSFDQAIGGFRAILTLQMLAALIATLIAVVLSWWLSHRLARPLRELADAAQSAARGEFNRRFTAEGSGEIAKLTQAFDSLLSDLREKSEIENYMADLAKYQPDAAADHTPGFSGAASAPESLGGAFLAVRLHDTLDANLVMPDKALMAFNQLLRNLEVSARLTGGKLAASAGNTAFLVFESAEAAFSAAGRILQDAASQGQKLAVAAALGRVIAGTAEWGSGASTSLLGVPVRQLEELLPDAAPGMLLVTAEFAKAAEGFPGARASSLAGAASGRNLTRLDLPKAEAADGDETRAGTLPLAESGLQTLRPKLAPGMLLGGRYEILSELGAGGMAVVYKARDRQLNEVVAIKTIKSEDSRDEAMLDAMKSEIRLARKITHRNVLRTYDFGDANGVPFISMEYVRGMTLRYLLQNRARVPFAAGLRIMRQVCTALMVAHEQSVVHRDIKPENVMLEPSGNAKLMDFGIASPMRHGDGQAAERMVVGTPRYASPEQLLGDPIDERTDIYACGVMMYYMFTGKLPFNERNMERLLEVKGREEYLAPADLVPGFPSELAALIASCLRADREKRPQSAEALLKRLEDMRV
ncbi:MAG TPA: protein kinase [Gammaproteobacteria bacterium]|nr:protein kinase [Gammaproteobacteria bacterium]